MPLFQYINHSPLLCVANNDYDLLYACLCKSYLDDALLQHCLPSLHADSHSWGRFLLVHPFLHSRSRSRFRFRFRFRHRHLHRPCENKNHVFFCGIDDDDSAAVGGYWY
jgi:hypothetical protein